MSNVSPQTATATLLWEGRTIAITYNTAWYRVPRIDRLLIECVQPQGGRLPISHSGYRCTYFNAGAGEALPGRKFATFAQAWLDDAARAQAWQEYLDAERQLSLFD